MKTQLTCPLAILIALSIYILSGNAYAKNISINTAKNVAVNLYNERSDNPSQNLTISKIIEEKENGVTCLYIVVYSNKGFAVVSADDIIQPVLGYSFESYYDENDIAPAFEFFILKRLRNQIYEAKQANITPDEKTIGSWDKYAAEPQSFKSKSFKSSIPLLTSVWHQRWPYNALCPLDTNSCSTCNDHVFVGCVATAMAQVLNYWEHPWHGTGLHSYTPESHPEYGVLEADFENTYYNFDNMPDTATTYSSDLAQLNYHCGVAVNMNYGPNGSGAWNWNNVDDISDALKNYFYFNDEADGIRRSSHPVTWVDKMKENLDLNRPVIYGAEDNQEDVSHAWVLDAYTTGDMFHCNWGWGGSNNGWFSIDDFTVGGNTFDTYEAACVKIHPKTGTLSGTLTLAGSPYTYNFNQYVNDGSQLTIEPGVEIIFNGRYGLKVKGQLNAEGFNGGFIDFNAQVPEIGMQGIMFENLNDNSMDSSKLFHCYFENGKGSWDPADRTPKGGSIYCVNSSKILIKDSRVFNSKADYGGGIACFDSSAIKIHSCLIDNDTAIMGGGIYLYNSDAVLSENNITGNYTTYSSGGGVYCDDSYVAFFKDIIQDNHAHFTGGIAFRNSGATMDSVQINNNYADNYSGGITAEFNSNIILNGCKVYNNTGEDGGALMCYFNSEVELNNVLIYNNTANTGTALFLISDASVSLNNCTLTGNCADCNWGYGTYIDETSTLTVKNSILWENAAEEIFLEPESSVNASYSIIGNGNWTGTGVIPDDPLLYSCDSDDYCLTWADYPMPDVSKSPAIDSGDPTSPPDPDGTRADMGYKPYEQTFTDVPAGDVSGTFTCANSPYYIFGDITLPGGDELIIEPCVTVMFQGDYKFEIRGRLLAEGTADQKITFAPADTVECWQGIHFINTSSNSQDSSKLVNCRITFGYADRAGGYTTNRSGGAITIYNSSDVLIKNCLLNKNHALEKGGAIYIEGSNPAIIDNTFCNNSAPNGGALYSHYATMTIQGGIVEHNEAEYGGAFYFNGTDPTLSGVTIRNNNAKFGGGIFMYGGSTPVFDPVNLCNLYLNYAYAAGLDLCGIGWNGGPVAVIVDTFTVVNPNSHFAYPFSEYTFDIQNNIIEQTSENLYVSMTGSDDNTGTDPSEPLQTMYMAMMKIMADETDTAVVYLADGVYSEGASGEVLPVNLRSYVSVIGTDMDDVTIYGEEKNQLAYCYDDNSFYIRDLNFQGGFAEDGGGLHLEHNSNPTFLKVKIHLNNATGNGGGLYCNDYSDPAFDTVYIENNTAEGSGGGIYLLSDSNPVFHNVTLYSNVANYGGGGLLARLYCDFTMDDVLINANSASYGGGLALDFYCDPVISNSNIINNNAVSYPGYPAEGGGVSTTYGSYPIFSNVDILGNESDNYAGGMYCSSNILFENGKINNNYAQVNGGGIYFAGGISEEKFINTEICQNQVTDYYGGAIFLISGNPEFINTTIANNQDFNEDGGGIYSYNSNPVFKNSILWDNTPDEILLGSNGDATIEYSDIEGGWTGTGNISSDPLFVSPATGDFNLSEGSPCIDTGTPDTTGLNLPPLDLGGNPRIYNSVIDMGAYEFQFPGAGIQLELTVFLEGPFNGFDMNTALNNTCLPLTQPYNTAPWNYEGTESVTAIPDVNIVDWVLIELRDAPSASLATPATTVAQQAAFLMNNGVIVTTDGISAPLFLYTPVSELFAAIRHRNHLAIMSAGPLSESGGVYYYDFTSGSGQAFNNGQKEITSGVWGMIAGDADASGLIDETDKSGTWQIKAGLNGYLNGDMNFDTEVNNRDKNDYWINNIGNSSQIPD